MNKILFDYTENCLSMPSIQMEHLSGAGATYQFEQKLRNHFSKKYALTFCNATTALLAIIVATEIKKGEIISTPYTWGGSISPFLFCGFKIVFGPVDPLTLNLDEHNIQSGLTNQSRFVLSTDFNGVPSNSKVIKEFCTENGLCYISDSAQSLGAVRNGFQAGFFADSIVLSFGPGKSFYGGEGGAILTDDEELHNKLIWYSQHPARQKKSFGLTGYNEYSPFNGRLNPLSAILLNEQFDENKERIASYQSQCFNFIQLLKDQGLIIVPDQISGKNSSTYFNLMFRIYEKVKLNDIQHYLQSNQMEYVAEYVKPKCIPFDNCFRNQFAKQYSVTKELIEQRDLIQNVEWVKFAAKKSLKD